MSWKHASETENSAYEFLDRLRGRRGSRPEAWLQYVGGYHLNGNMTTRGNQAITWDVENRPVTVSGGASFVYDGDGNRVEKTKNSQTIVYANKYYEKNITTGVATSNYFLGDRLVAKRAGSTLDYIHQDSLGSTTAVSDINGAPVGSLKYYPFGSTRSGSVPTDKLFTGQRLDSTGLYYYNARYYNPTIGRFISPDNEVSDPEDPQNLNRYSYVLNNPLKLTDPTGRQAELDEWMEMQVLAGSDTLSSAISSDTAAEYSGATDQYMEYATLAGYTKQTQQDLLAATELPQFAAQTPVEQTQSVTTEPPAPSQPTTLSSSATASAAGLGAIVEDTSTTWDEVAGIVGGISISPVVAAFGELMLTLSLQGDTNPDITQGEVTNGLIIMRSTGERRFSPSNNETISKRGTGQAPATGDPDSYYEQVDPQGQVRSRTHYDEDENGNRDYREDFDHTHYDMIRGLISYLALTATIFLLTRKLAIK